VQMEDKRRYLGWFLSASIILTIVFIVIFALLLIVFIKTSAKGIRIIVRKMIAEPGLKAVFRIL